MKIAVFDTLYHPTPILKEWAVGFSDLNHDVDFYGIQHHTILSCLDKFYDIIVYVGDLNITHFEQVKQNNPNVTIVYSIDSMQPHYVQYKHVIDFFITTQHGYSELDEQFKNAGLDLYSIPLAGNNHLFYPTDSPNEYDVCFIGTLAHGYREEDKYLYPFIEKYKFFLAGMTYKHHGIPFLDYSQANAIRNQTAININFHYDYQRLNEGNPLGRVDLNQSVYNIALSGGFQICDHPLVSELFEGAVVVAPAEHWPELIEYYLNNHEERKALAKKSYDIAIKNHTWKVRMQEFLQIVEKHKS
jgi:glycosyltransferase involved in cell wall biosynthesis